MNPVQESVSQQIMADSNSFLEQDHSLTPAIVVTVSAAIALVANYYGMLHGITIVIPHLLYLPVVFCAFFFPRRGVIFSLVLSALYLLMTDLLLPGDTSSLISAASRCIILIIIAIVVSYLSGSLAKRERTIRAAKEEWERTFDAIPDLIALIDGQHRIIRINRAMAERLGMSPDKAVGLHCYEIVHHSALPPSFCPHAKLLQDGEEHSEEFHEDTLGGDFMVTASPLFDENGALAGSVHIARDITEQLSSQQKIRQLAAIVRYSTDAIISMDLEGTITSWNAGAAAIYGYDEDEITGNNVTVLIPENLRNEVRQLLDRVRQGEHIDHYETVRIRKNRVSIPVSLTESPILDARGTVVGASVIAQDITERKRAESALIQANRKLNILSSITRHDILNKITALYAYLDISRDLCADPEQATYVGKEIELVQVLQRQVEFTRYYQDIGVQEPQWEDIGEIFKKAVSELPLSGISVRVDISGLQVYADPLIEKVFYNLVENSIRHGEHVTGVRISGQKTPAGYSVIYEDNGTGVPSDIKLKLFQRGFGKHTGMGLFLSKEILAITGITIIENGEPGKGVRFELLVPEGVYRTRVGSIPDPAR